MAKVIYKGFVKDPADPRFKKGWLIGTSPASNQQSEKQSENRKSKSKGTK